MEDLKKCLRPKRTHWSRPARTLWSFARKPPRIQAKEVYVSLAPACPISNGAVLNMHVGNLQMLGIQKLVLKAKPSNHKGIRQANDEEQLIYCLQIHHASSYTISIDRGKLFSTRSCFKFQQVPAASRLPDRPPTPRAQSDLGPANTAADPLGP